MCYGGCFLLVFAENVVRVVDFRLGRFENTAPVHESKLRKRVDFPCTAVLQSMSKGCRINEAYRRKPLMQSCCVDFGVTVTR